MKRTPLISALFVLYTSDPECGVSPFRLPLEHIYHTQIQYKVTPYFSSQKMRIQKYFWHWIRHSVLMKKDVRLYLILRARKSCAPFLSEAVLEEKASLAGAVVYKPFFRICPS